MRILIHSLNYAPEPTGTGKYTAEMAEWLAEHGHQVDVIAAPPHYPAWSVFPEYRDRGFHIEHLRGVRVFRIPVRLRTESGGHRVGAKTRLVLETTYTLNSLPRWARLMLSRTRYDVAIAVCPPLQAGLLPFLARALRGVPWVFHIQDLQVDAALRLGLLGDGLAGKALYHIESFLLRRASSVTTITQAMANRLVEKGVRPERVAVFPNWANLDEIRPGPRDNAFRTHILGAAADDTVVMYAGNVGAKQGLGFLLDAAAQLAAEPNLRFVIVGDGVAKPGLEQTAKNMRLGNVQFLPTQPRERLSQVLASADIHAVIQRPEAADLVMPSKLTNIFAAGRPVVATAAPGTALCNAVLESGAGAVIPPLDTTAFAQAIVGLRAVADRATAGKRARDFAENHWNQASILESMVTHLQGVAS